jgi:hypothetical protein
MKATGANQQMFGINRIDASLACFLTSNHYSLTRKD